MKNIFGVQEGQTLVEYLDETAFDEKFEIDIEKDIIHNIFHVENKYYVPIHIGSFREMYYYAKKYMIHPEDKSFNELMDPGTLEKRFKESDPPGFLRAECREKMLDGSYRWVQYMGVKGKENGVPDNLIYFYVYDIHNQKNRREGKIVSSLSDKSRDELTGLMYREAFINSANQMIKSKGGSWCCVGIDIQHFTIFNSWYGKEKGDYVLAKIGSCLRECEESGHAVAAYLGRDNFALFVRHNLKVIEDLYNRIKDIINSYSKTLGFMPALGIYLLNDNEKVDIETYDKARVAVGNAKKSYVQRICYFDSMIYTRKKEEDILITDFQHALKNGEISFYLQPQCRISTGKIVGVEALARWIKPNGEVISPGAFVPLLEKSGFITELDKCVWENVCRWIRDVLDKDLHPVPVSVNVSQIDLLTMDVAAYLYGLTERYNIPARLLKVEITESAYASNIDKVGKLIDELKRKGFMVFMDDFGSGYSSLSMLDLINVDVLKLDMLFMRKDSSLSKRGISILESIISMARSLEIPIIMEGVEFEEQARFLHNTGCRYAQGYYFYRPMPIAQYEQLLQNAENFDYDGYTVKATEIFHTREFLNENLFTDTVLNNILGPVAFYQLDGEDLTITRFNEQFYEAISDAKMESRCSSIQDFIVKEDWPTLYRALKEADEYIANGGRCELRFYKSDGSVFWFHIHFFHLKTEGTKKLYYGQIQDVTHRRMQSISFFEVLRKKADVTMKMNLDNNIIQYATGDSTLYEVDLPSMNLEESIRRTIDSRIEKEEDKETFAKFFDIERLRAAYEKAVYHEVLHIDFRLRDKPEPVEIATYYIRYSQNQDLILYAFTKALNS